ncbi:MAG: ParB/RepB/Spo0J family partition protein [Patescibacteria group bacterium]
MPSQFLNNSIFWIEVDKIRPNPFQPRKDFDEARIKDLADSIRMYGVLQPLVVTRRESLKDDGGLAVEYELISGERRLRASKLAGVREVPAIIRNDSNDARTKLELAIIENLQREDLNAIDRARAFKRLVDEFGFKHHQIGTKIGKSREYVSNSMRILALSEEILQALSEGKINEGHTRPLLMLIDRPEEQMTLFKEIIYKKINVREAEMVSRRIAYDRARKQVRMIDPDIIALEEKLAVSLGTRVKIQRGEQGGKISIDFFTDDDLRMILALMETNKKKQPTEMLEKFIQSQEPLQENLAPIAVLATPAETAIVGNEIAPEITPPPPEPTEPPDDDLYSVRNFTI